MKLGELNSMKDRIRFLSSRIERYKVDPATAPTEDERRAEIERMTAERRQIIEDYRAALRRLSPDNYIERSIYLHFAKDYTWRKVAQITTGRLDTADAIRQAASRYTW